MPTLKSEIIPIEYPTVVNIYTKITGTQKYIYIPGCPHNSKKIFREFIKRGNHIINNDFACADTINICLSPNYGGKSSVMAMALAPIFNNQRSKLTFSIASKKKKVGLRKIERGVYYEPSENVVGIKGSVRIVSPKFINVIIGNTYSAGEIICIALKSISDKVAITFIGTRTAGATTNIGWNKLSNGGFIEYPIGYMADRNGNTYPNGIPADVIDEPIIK